MRLQTKTVAAIQAGYYATTAVVPLVSRSAFERVTGPKTEWWLVITVSALVASIAGALGLAARGRPGPDTVVLGVGSAAGMALVDVVYVARRRISPVYLVDAAVQMPVAAAWVLAARDELRMPRPSR